MNLQIYDVRYRRSDGTLVPATLAADDRREALRIAKHVACAKGLEVVENSIAVHIDDPEPGDILFEGDFLQLPGFKREACGLYAKSRHHAEQLAIRLASEQQLVFCPASIRLAPRDISEKERFIHLLNTPRSDNMFIELPNKLPPLNQRSADVGAAHDKKVLGLLARAGWLNAAQVREALDLSSETTARRVLTRLLSQKLIARSMPMRRMYAYYLTAAGLRAAEAASGTTGGRLVDGATIARTAEHRMAANTAVLRAMNNERVVSVKFEHELAQRGAGFPSVTKIPDGLVSFGKDGVVWLEVEASTRSTAAWGALLHFLGQAFEPGARTELASGDRLVQVYFLCREPEQFKSELERRLLLLEAKEDVRASTRQLNVYEGKTLAHPVRRLAAGETAYILSCCAFDKLEEYL